MQAPREVSSVAHHPTAVTSNEASMTSHRPQQSSDTSVPLLVEPPAESNRRPHPYHSCPSPANTGAAQVKMTRMTVADRMAPRAPFWDGTQMARPTQAACPAAGKLQAGDPTGGQGLLGGRREAMRAGASTLDAGRGGRGSALLGRQGSMGRRPHPVTPRADAGDASPEGSGSGRSRVGRGVRRTTFHSPSLRR